MVCLHQQQGGLLSPAVGEVEHLTAAALCQQVADGKAAGLAVGDELDGLCAVLLQVAQGIQVAGKGGSVISTGVGAQSAVLAHGKGLVHALSVHHPQLKGAVGVDRLALGGTAVGAGVGAVAVVLPVVAGGGDLLRLLVAALRAGMLFFTCSGAGGLLNRSPLAVGVGRSHIVSVTDMVGVTVVLPVMAQSWKLICPSTVTTVVGCSVLIVASIICRARCSAGGFFFNVLGWTFFAEVLAMDDLLQFIIDVEIPQLCIIANGVYKAACSGVITSCAYLSLSTVHIDIRVVVVVPVVPVLLLFHFKQHIVADVDRGTGNCTIDAS